MAWSDTTNNLRQMIGQQTSNLANIGQSERESRRARNVALLKILAEMGMDIGKMGFSKSEREAAQGYTTSEREAVQGYGTSEREAGQQYRTSEREAGQGYGTSEREAEQGFEAGESQLDRALQEALAKYNRDTQWGTADRYTAGKGDKSTDPLGQLVSRMFDTYTMTPGGTKIFDKATGDYITEGLNNKDNFADYLEFSNSWKPEGVDSGEWLQAVSGIWGSISEPRKGPGDDETKPSGKWTFATPGPAALNTPEVMAIEQERMGMVQNIKNLRDALKPQAKTDPEVKRVLDDIPMLLKLTSRDELEKLLVRLEALVGRKQQPPPARMQLGVPLSNPNKAPEPTRTMPLYENLGGF